MVEVNIIKKQREIYYLLQSQKTDAAEIVRQKELLKKQGCLVITIIDGQRAMEDGLRELIKNHLP